MGDIHEDDIARRLHSLAEQPVEPSVAQRHASYIAAAAPVISHRRRRPAVTAAFVAGALLGGTGLAAALPGPLPTQASSAARTALEAVNLVDEERDDRFKKRDERAKAAARSESDEGEKNEARAGRAAKVTSGHGVARFTEGCTNPDGSAFTGNHGQYVRSHVHAVVDDPGTALNERAAVAKAAAQSDCGKPLNAVDSPASAGSEAAENRGARSQRPDRPAKPAEGEQPADETKGAPAQKRAGSQEPAAADEPARTGRPDSPGNPEAPRGRPAPPSGTEGGS